MEPQNTQLTPEEAKASMGIATHLQDMLLSQNNQDASKTPGIAPEPPSNQTSPEDTKNQIEGLESRIMDELTTIRAEMKTQGDGKQELADLKKQIESILLSND